MKEIERNYKRKRGKRWLKRTKRSGEKERMKTQKSYEGFRQYNEIARKKINIGGQHNVKMEERRF